MCYERRRAGACVDESAQEECLRKLADAQSTLGHSKECSFYVSNKKQIHTQCTKSASMHCTYLLEERIKRLLDARACNRVCCSVRDRTQWKHTLFCGSPAKNCMLLPLRPQPPRSPALQTTAPLRTRDDARSGARCLGRRNAARCAFRRQGGCCFCKNK